MKTNHALFLIIVIGALIIIAVLAAYVRRWRVHPREPVKATQHSIPEYPAKTKYTILTVLMLGSVAELSGAPPLLQQIDTLAADTWAEGDFGFRFVSAEHYLKAVRVEFDITHPHAKAAVRNEREAGPWQAKVSGKNGRWRVIVWARDSSPIRGKLTPDIKSGLTQAILWTETTILKRSNLITHECPPGF